MVKPRMDRSFAEMVKGSKGKEGEVVRVEVRGEEISESLRKLEHCLIGSWNPSSANGVDLERLGWLMARSWGLQGKLELASLEKKAGFFWSLSMWVKPNVFFPLEIGWWEVSNWSWNDGALGVVVRKKVGVGRKYG